MRRSLPLAATALALALGGAALADMAHATKPLGHVHGVFTAERMGAPPGDRLALQGIVTIKVNAFDRTLETRPCLDCATIDDGTVTQTFGPGTFREGEIETYEVLDVVLEEGRASLLVQGRIPFTLVFHDGGAPGSEVVGAENSLGLSPTRDWYSEHSFQNPGNPLTGFLTSGNIHVQELPT